MSQPKTFSVRAFDRIDSSAQTTIKPWATPESPRSPIVWSRGSNRIGKSPLKEIAEIK